MRFRRADFSDIPKLHALIDDAYRGDAAKAGWTHEADMLAGQRIDPDMLGDLLRDGSQNLLVAEDDGGILGCVNVVHNGDYAYLGLLTVEPRRQARGLGKQLAKEAERLAQDLGLKTMKMTVIRHRPELIAWYERQGYTNTGRREPFPTEDRRYGIPLRDDLEFVVLEKILP
jgi:ribosomal protein S18 acetylase RimI-like enzyme